MLGFWRNISTLFYLVLNSFKPKRATADNLDNDFLVINGLDTSKDEWIHDAELLVLHASKQVYR